MYMYKLQCTRIYCTMYNISPNVKLESEFYCSPPFDCHLQTSYRLFCQYSWRILIVKFKCFGLNLLIFWSGQSNVGLLNISRNIPWSWTGLGKIFSQFLINSQAEDKQLVLCTFLYQPGMHLSMMSTFEIWIFCFPFKITLQLEILSYKTLALNLAENMNIRLQFWLNYCKTEYPSSRSCYHLPLF